MKIIKNTENTAFEGCDFVLKFDSNRKIKLLQLTDMQIIDATQRREPDRLRVDEINAWRPENFDALCGDQIRSLVAQTSPNMIFITGDVTYGSFDDNGKTLTYICKLMDSFKIPWAVTFGNHDNESKMGVDWQCEQFEKSEYCLFKRGSVTGNSNFCVGIAVGDALVRVLHMVDSNGCIQKSGIYDDQIELIKANTAAIRKAQKKNVRAFVACHIPVKCFRDAETAKGYFTEEREFYTIGVDVPADKGDFGCKYESKKIRFAQTSDDFLDILKECNVDGFFVGHCHNINTCIDYEGIRWVYGLKTGQYDYHNIGQLGGTLVTLEGDNFEVQHVPALALCGVYPSQAPMFKDFFAEDKILLNKEKF